VTVEGQRVPPWLVWWLPVSQTTRIAKTPTLQPQGGELQAPTTIRPFSLTWARPQPPKGLEGSSRMGLQQSLMVPPYS